MFIDFLTNNFNNRELASICWLFILVIWLFFGKSFRVATWNVIKSIFDRKIFFILSLTSAYVVGIILILRWIGLWELSMLKLSIYWFFGTALVNMFNITKASENEGFFKSIVIDNLKFIVLIEFIVSVHHFSFWGELFFLPLITFISLVQVYAEKKEDYKSTYNLMTIVLVIISIILIVLSVKDIVQSIQDYANYDTLISFAFPVVLGSCFIPFLFVIAVFVEYELFFKRFTFFIEDKKILRYARRKAKKYYKFNFRLIHSDTHRVMRELYTGITIEEIDNLFCKQSK